MNARTRFIFGGIGGAVPVLLFLINLDFDQYIREASTATSVGYIVRTIGLFLLGGFVAYLHDKEENRLTVFLLGISAPSLIAGSLSLGDANQNLGKLNLNSPLIQHSGSIFNKSTFFSLVPSAYAQSITQETTDHVKQYNLPSQSESSQFLKGLLGNIGVAPKVWFFVISGESRNQGEAKSRAQEIRNKGFSADLYKSFYQPNSYDVVIGAQLTESEADELASKAIKKGIPTYLAGLSDSGFVQIKNGPKK